MNPFNRGTTALDPYCMSCNTYAPHLTVGGGHVRCGKCRFALGGVDRQTAWDVRFLGLAEEVASWSKDPSTKVGAVITDGVRIVSVGFNGFARKVRDLPERYADRDEKLRRTLHAEHNAILFARPDLAGCTLYTWPFMPCAHCSSVVIQKDIARVVAPPLPGHAAERWGQDTGIARGQFKEAGVCLDLIEVVPDP